MEENKHQPVTVSIQALKRMPYYLECLKKLHNSGVENVSAASIADELGLNEIQVRKDLAAVSKSGGKPKKGFSVGELKKDMEDFLGYNNHYEAVLVGAGHLGQALLSYNGFETYGITIIAAFDRNENKIGKEIAGKNVLPLEKIGNLCKRLNVHIGIITVPAQEAQSVCDLLVESGIQAIWNFAPVHLKVPEHILVQNENMAASLALLSKHLKEKEEN